MVIFQNKAVVPALIILIIMCLYHPKKKEAWKSFFRITFVGVALDSVLSLSGVFVFETLFFLIPIPLWLILLWCAFAMTLPYGYSFISKYPIALQAVIGGLASFSYLIGRNLDSVDYGFSVLGTQSFLVFIWGLLIPLYFILEIRRENTDVILD